MALFSSSKPTERLNIEGGFVELQFVSKGVKSEYQARMAGLAKDLDGVNSDSQEIPKGVEFDSVLKKVNDSQYFLLSKAIKSWSEKADVNEETVKELDDEVFKLIFEKVNEMNGLSLVQEKN